VFHTRCQKYREQLGESDRERCRGEVPLLEEKGRGHFVACHFPEVRTEVIEGIEEGTVGTARPVASGASAAPSDATVQLGGDANGSASGAGASS
jgi:hypothetical protein